MKKSYLFLAAAALAFASCANDDYVGLEGNGEIIENGEIGFSSNLPALTRASVGKDAATTLGGNFIVEGIKGTESTTSWTGTNVVFDNYLVVWGENTAGVKDADTNDWWYVGVTEANSTHTPDGLLAALGRTVDQQTIKYWDYSAPNYAFMAYSTGSLDMTDGAPTAGTSVQVTKIEDGLPGDATVSYSFTAKSANDFAQCYFTDVTPVAPGEYGKPVKLTFKNLSAKVRVGLYETIPGYSVKDVQFYADNSIATPAVYTVVAAGSNLVAGETYYTSATGEGSFVEPDPATHTDVTANTYWTLTSAAVSDPTPGNDATFFLPAGESFAEDGTIKISYPLVGTDNTGKGGYNKAEVDVDVSGATTTTTTTKTFGTLDYKAAKEHGEDDGSGKFLGRTLATATMAGVDGDNYFTYVIPASTGTALTLRCNYTLVSTDGSKEEIKVWGAKAEVPANFCEWQPNYAYTYIFKISDNTNGATEKLGGSVEGLRPITFDAVVAAITDAAPEQTTVTTVATPSVTTYQKGHVLGQEYAAGDIYVQSMKAGSPQTITNALIYTTTDNTATEADVINALQMGTTDGSGNVTGRNGLVLTKTTLLATNITKIPAADGTDIDVTSGEAGKFTAVASKNYVFVYDYTTGTPAATEIYSYDNAASTAAPSDWAENTNNPYYTKNSDGTYTQVTTAWAAGTYYKVYKNNNRTYAVKVIKTGTAY